MLVVPPRHTNVGWMLLLATVLPVIFAKSEPKSEQQRVAAAHALRDTIHRLPAAQAAAAFAALERRTEPPPRQDKIDHFVVLYMENQAMLRTMGCQDLPGLDGVSCAMTSAGLNRLLQPACSRAPLLQ